MIKIKSMWKEIEKYVIVKFYKIAFSWHSEVQMFGRRSWPVARLVGSRKNSWLITTSRQSKQRRFMCFFYFIAALWATATSLLVFRDIWHIYRGWWTNLSRERVTHNVEETRWDYESVHKRYKIVTQPPKTMFSTATSDKISLAF